MVTHNTPILNLKVFIINLLIDSSEDAQNGARQRTRRVRRPRRFWMHDILMQREVSGIHYDVFCYL